MRLNCFIYRRIYYWSEWSHMVPPFNFCTCERISTSEECTGTIELIVESLEQESRCTFRGSWLKRKCAIRPGLAFTKCFDTKIRNIHFNGFPSNTKWRADEMKEQYEGWKSLAQQATRTQSAFRMRSVAADAAITEK